MADRTFSLRSILALRESELARIERELSRILGERAREKERTREIQQRLSEGYLSLEKGLDGSGSGFYLACYAWLERLDVQLGEQRKREEKLDGEYEKIRQSWRKARMEKEKILILREKVQGQERRRTLIREERSMEEWILLRDSEGPPSGTRSS